MPTAIVTASTGFHIGLGIAAFIAMVFFFAWRDYKKICRRTEAKRPPVEVEEFEDPWASLPPKWKPPVAESHLAKEHLGRGASA
jgi:hypothetical protein